MVINTILKYLKIYKKLFKFAVQLETEYRTGFAIEIFIELIYFTIQVANFLIIYANVKNIAGWNRAETIFLLGLNMVFSEIVLGLTVVHNLKTLPNNIAQGKLDFTLLKPINSQFAVSLWRPYFAFLPSMLAGIVLCIWAIKDGGLVIDLSMLIPFSLVFIAGLVIGYSIIMILASMSFYFISAPMTHLGTQIVFWGRIPTSYYNPVFKIIFMSIIPVGLIVCVPTQTLLNKDYMYYWPFYSIIIAIIMLKLSNIAWNKGLQNYTSAN